MAYKYLGIDHVQLAAPKGCEQEARKFYANVLGMQEVSKPDKLRARGGVWFQCGSHQVHIGVQEDFTPATKAHPAFEVQNINELREHLLQQNIQIKEDDELVGVVRFFISDPFGNRIEILQRSGI